ncbi:MAG TPA: Gfo/Idh/MocA family oxidoreductase [Herpetosiphonaceae bacterium]|nr:Gfo/Idh/MocA family oxidoreductase [Herpetosiphonaceae bacterium]
MPRVRWAVVGTSDFALDWIARGITMGRNSELAAIVSRDPERGRAAAAKTGASLHFTSIDALDTDVVDGVFIVTPNQAHAPLAIAAARRGLHVIVEKPMAPTLQECEAMIDAANDAGVVLAVAHCMHWTPPVMAARELIEQGRLGMVAVATISASYNSRPNNSWRQTDTTEQGGGPLYDMGVHAIDTIQSLVGPISRVAALLGHHVYNYPAEDSATLLLHFASGAHGVVEANGNCNQNGFEIAGTEGRIWSTQWLGREFRGNLWIERVGRTSEIPLEQANVYVPQIEHVSGCVLTGDSPVISGSRGRDNVAVITAAIEAARTGSRVSVAQSGTKST